MLRRSSSETSVLIYRYFHWRSHLFAHELPAESSKDFWRNLITEHSNNLYSQELNLEQLSIIALLGIQEMQFFYLSHFPCGIVTLLNYGNYFNFPETIGNLQLGIFSLPWRCDLLSHSALRRGMDLWWYSTAPTCSLLQTTAGAHAVVRAHQVQQNAECILSEYERLKWKTTSADTRGTTIIFQNS